MTSAKNKNWFEIELGQRLDAHLILNWQIFVGILLVKRTANQKILGTKINYIWKVFEIPDIQRSVANLSCKFLSVSIAFAFGR